MATTSASDLGALRRREPRRSGYAQRPSGAAGAGGLASAAGAGGLRSARGASENVHPSAKAGGRRSPRLRRGSGSSVTKLPGASAAAAARHLGGGALADVTNLAADAGAGRAKRGGALTDITNLAANAEAAVAKPPKQAEAAPAPAGAAAPAEETEATGAQAAEEYAPDIVDRFFRDEAALLPRPDYMDAQADLTGKMRTILIDWLVEVQMKYRLRAETLHLAGNLIDRYLAKRPTTRRRLQLIGVVAMFIAAKFEEIDPPALHEWVYITDYAYTQAEVIETECNMLTALSFQVVVPTAAHFFPVLQKANGCSAVHRELAQYILELGLLDMRMLQHAPSHVVSAALLLSNELRGRCPPWPPGMALASRHEEAALRGCAAVLRQLLEADRAGAGGQLQAVHTKFSRPQHHSVATTWYREVRD